MPMTKAEAIGVAKLFLNDYPGAVELAYKFRENTTELYGARAGEVPKGMKGGYLPRPTEHNGRSYKGQIDVSLENITDARDLLVSLRHEVLGHYGANTFPPAEKRALLDGLIAAREEPSLKPSWDEINRRYSDCSLDVRAEEVFALHCEGITPLHHVGNDLVQQRGQQSFMETCIARVRPMQIGDLQNITCMVAQGLHDRSRTQQTFPGINELFRRDNGMKQKKPFHEVVAERLIEQLKAGTAPWQKPWEPGAASTYLPINPTTGKRYKGINAMFLMSQGRSDPRWMTYKQAAAVDAQVLKGEKGTLVQYWKFTEEQIKRDDQGKPVLDGNGKPVKMIAELERPRVFFATVFNAEQIDGLPPLERKEQPEHQWDAVERAEHILKASGAAITHAPGDRAFYRPVSDSITLPERGQFSSADRYYATALHELGHWTGHHSRLDRDLSHPFGSAGYAKEELRAEIASMILGDELGIGHDPEQHAAYVGSWIKSLEEDPLEIFRASADAEKIQGYVLAFEHQQVQELDNMQTQEKGMDLPISNKEQQDRLLAAMPTEVSANLQAVSEARRQLSVAEIGGTQFESTASERLGVNLPSHWNGGVQVQGNVYEEAEGLDGKERHVTPAHVLGVDPEFWGVYAEADDGTHLWVADFDSQEQAEDLADQLAVIDALTESNEHEQAAKLARIAENRIRRDPNSSDSEISTAKEDRKAAEAVAILNDADLQRRIAELERRDSEQQPLETGVQPPREEKSERAYINVSFKDKDEAKGLGARWDRQERSWYVPPGADTTPFAKWMGKTPEAGQSPEIQQAATVEHQYLAVPYGERKAAKAAGAQWDKAAKSWYAGPGADMEKLQRWLPDNVPGQQGPAMSPREEFAEALRSLGCEVSGVHPIMDGKKHRIRLEDDKSGVKHDFGAGFYVGHLDGHPAGYIKNNRTGLDMKWKSKGYSLDPQEKAKLQAEAAEKLAARAAEQERLHEATAQRISKQTAGLVAPAVPTSYMREKGIQVHAGALTDKNGQTTYIPAIDAGGKQWTTQYIQANGTKRFAKDSRKEGCFHAVGGIEAVAAAPALVIGEGYATASTLAEVWGHGTIAAFDSGNLKAVAQDLREKFPDKPVIVAGDDDRQLVLTQGVNSGREKALEAAKAVGGQAIFPVFAPGENEYPKELEPVTPQVYRNHSLAAKALADAEKDPEGVKLTTEDRNKLQGDLLSEAQLEALAKMKRHTDFNDLANNSVLGREGVERQVRAAVGLAIEKAEQKQEKRQVQRQEQKPRRAVRI
ncbi:zincin-like metallopeptidase domain-containing protein [Shewanella indica]|uniref:Zincin-like metallopeptidase domain-containing protein n=1 Tax=Shewanella indica TaxID=768528 RepID=A0ABU4QJ30_9GAMM|nr:zincin-like metallopeptidase domain-containing protein [Shewanella indica]MDX6018608.1 zincin-like metallopeptidase domain-containing protein [Shewanella indica]MDX6018665.1 zincin-like metallopeptidase domain-containing protein [Shewanella indica]